MELRTLENGLDSATSVCKFNQTDKIEEYSVSNCYNSSIGEIPQCEFQCAFYLCHSKAFDTVEQLVLLLMTCNTRRFPVNKLLQGNEIL